MIMFIFFDKENLNGKIIIFFIIYVGLGLVNMVEMLK